MRFAVPRPFFRLFLVCLALISCAANYPNIKKTQCVVIFSYESPISYPSLSMSVFVAASSPYNRVSSMKVEHAETRLSWQIDKPEFVGNKKDKDVWFGSSRLIVPSHCDLPQGSFSVSIVDARQEKASVRINVEYPEKLLSMTFSEAAETDEFASLTVETLAIYGKKGEALYIGPQISDFSTDEQILSYYPNAQYCNVVKTSENGKFAVFLPPKIFVEAEKENAFEKMPFAATPAQEGGEISPDEISAEGLMPPMPDAILSEENSALESGEIPAGEIPPAQNADESPPPQESSAGEVGAENPEPPAELSQNDGGKDS